MMQYLALTCSSSCIKIWMEDQTLTYTCYTPSTASCMSEVSVLVTILHAYVTIAYCLLSLYLSISFTLASWIVTVLDLRNEVSVKSVFTYCSSDAWEREMPTAKRQRLAELPTDMKIASPAKPILRRSKRINDAKGSHSSCASINALFTTLNLRCTLCCLSLDVTSRSDCHLRGRSST